MARVEVLKTYKLFIDGKFPRTESGRYFKAKDAVGEFIGNMCLASRKDFRNAIKAARKSQSSWQDRSAYNRGQILYRIAENIEARKKEFSDLIAKEQGLSQKEAMSQVESAIDRVIYFSGWTDKLQQVFSSVNPVASNHFNFSILEPMGVISILSDSFTSFFEFISVVSASILSGNSIVILAGENASLSALTFAEVLAHSDVPNGVVNILSGKAEELSSHFASHMDSNALILVGKHTNRAELETLATENVKRVFCWSHEEIKASKFENPYYIKALNEVKTTWHPIENISSSSSTY